MVFARAILASVRGLFVTNSKVIRLEMIGRVRTLFVALGVVECVRSVRIVWRF